MKLLIEVRGGCIQNIIASEDVSIVILDYDNDEQDLTPGQPDCLTRNDDPIWKYMDPDADQDIIKELKKINF